MSGIFTAPGLFSTDGTCPPGGALWTDGRCLPESVIDVHPIALFIFNVATPAASAILLLFLLRSCLQQKTLTWYMLFALASASTFWLETFGDWAQHLLYSPKIIHYTLPFLYSAPHNPVWMPLTYAGYWTAHAWVILKLAQWLQTKYPGMSLLKAMLYLSAPVTFVWNLIVEGSATYSGLWTYDPGIGFKIIWSTGGIWPLTWPVFLMFGWINLIAYLVRLPEDGHEPNFFERWAGLDRKLMAAKWRRDGRDLASGPALTTDGNKRFQALRLAWWIIVFNVTFALTLNLPLTLMRWLGHLNSMWLPPAI